MSVSIYVEGGRGGKAMKSACRRGFSSFFKSAGLHGRMPKVVASGSREDTFSKFRIGLDRRSSEQPPVLLVDSEAPVAKGNSVWEHLRLIDNWTRPEQAREESAYLMVQCMESWFLADKHCLERFFGQNFLVNALPGQTAIEEVPKSDVLAGLRDATRQCKTKGQYSKGRHSFDILAKIDPASVVEASPHAKRLIAFLREETNRR